ncbi:fimbria/pilus periplasmic chaperone [Raoultella ornithinolytica]|uniref:fimbria/pilus periplasmic chaperone n=1 Tax=Raoultella ornithinolytica TaxID=54291 RepID=UPI0036D6A45E
MFAKHVILMVLFVNSVFFVLVPTAQAAISLDRTRIVFPGNTQSLTLNVFNKDQAVPYQAHAWLEDSQGAKLNDKSAFIIMPPEQTIEPRGKAQLRIQAMPAASKLPQDQETLFYLNLLEVPPKSGKDNVVQVILQTRIKMFYRPEALTVNQQMMPFQKELTLTKNGTSYISNNSTPYFITLVTASKKKEGMSRKVLNLF